MMIWTESSLYLAIGSIGLLVAIGIAEKQPLAAIWTKVDIVGVTSRSRISFLIAIAKSIFSTRQLASQGYRDFNKALDKPFALPTTWMQSGAVLILPPSRLHLLGRSDKISGGEWTNLHGLVENIQLPYYITDPSIYQNVLHFEVVRRKMARKHMDRIGPITADEIASAFDDIWGTSPEWKTINGWEACGRVVSRASQRILIGLPLSRDEKLLELSRQYANALLISGSVINCFPRPMRWLIAPLVAIRPRYLQARFLGILVPVVEDRIREWKADKDAGPDDFLHWMIPICAKEGTGQLDATRIALRLISLLTPLMFAICYVFAHCVLDIHSSASRTDIIEGLEEECTHISAQDPGLTTSESVEALFRVDSALRESMRVSDVAVTNLFRDVISGDMDIGNGLRVGPGVRMGFPTQDVHLDADNYQDPKRFDAFRFSRPFEDVMRLGDARERELVTTTTVSFLPFGYGRHACPGRWFAAQLMKQALAYMVLNYEVELVGYTRGRRALLNTMVPPVDARMRIRRKL